MQAILTVKLQELDDKLLRTIKDLLSQDVEVVIKKEGLPLAEYDRELPLHDVVREFAEAGYSTAFVHDLQEGLKTSSVYAPRHENQAGKR